MVRFTKCRASQQGGHGALELLSLQTLATDQGALYWYAKGIQTGMQIRALDQQKWSRLGVIIAIAFGTISFLHRFD